MRKNHYTLVRVSADRNTAGTYVSRSFDRIDAAALEVIEGCIREDMEESFEPDDKPSFDECFCEGFRQLPEDLSDTSFTDDFEREGIPVWEYDDGVVCITYVLHQSICEDGEGLPDTMSVGDIRHFSDSVKKAADNLAASARKAVRDILKRIPSHEIVSDDALGYLDYENMGGEFVEATVHGVLLGDDGTIRMTSDVDYDDDDKPVVRDWYAVDREMTFDEYDHYSTIDWVKTLTMIADYVELHPEILG